MSHLEEVPGSIPGQAQKSFCPHMAALEPYCKFPVNDFTFKNKDIVETV